MTDLSAFASRRTLEAERLGSGRPVTRDATTLFVDIAGFTGLTDRLGRLGTSGAEELSGLLRSFFRRATDGVLDLGGDPVAFGGDALTVVFDGPAEATAAAALRAASLLRDVARETAGTETSVGPVTLQTRIGIAHGPVTTALVRAGRRSTPVLSGAGLDRAVAAEGQARPDAVVVHTSVEGGARRESLRRGGGFEQPTSPAGQVTDGWAPTREPSVELEGLVHPVIADRLVAGTGVLERHRWITVGFVHFPSFSSDAMAEHLQTVATLMRLVDSGGGELVQVSGGDKGMVAMTVFGAPVAHADDSLRAVQSMLELRGCEPSVAVGLATGPVFAALIGSQKRRFLGHFGRTVNLAARMMQAARPGELLVESVTWRETSGSVRAAGRARSMQFRGHPGAVEVRALERWSRGRRRAEGRADPPIVGRAAELGAVERLIDDLVAGRGRVLRLEAEHGAGASRLVREALRLAEARGVATVALDAADHPRGDAVGLWRALVGALAGIPPQAGRNQWEATITGLLPDAVGQIAALGAVLGLPLRDSTAVTSQDPALASELAQGLLLRLVARAAGDRPRLVVVDDVHRLDTMTFASLQELGRVAASLGVVLAGALLDDEPVLSADHGVQRARVGSLSPPETAVVAADAWRELGGGSPPPWLAREAMRRAGGNPLVVRTVVKLLHDSWRPGRPPPAPDIATGSITRLMAERFDRLHPDLQQVLNVLAVAGRPQPQALVSTLLDGDPGQEVVARAADELRREGLVTQEVGDTRDAGDTREAADTDGMLRLGHEVLQEVVYEGLSHAERQRLHRRLVRHLRERDAGAEEIAEHVLQLDDPQQARQWYPLAAAACRAARRVPQAVTWWRRALPLLPVEDRVTGEVELRELLLVAGHANDVLDRVDAAHPAALPGELLSAGGPVHPELSQRWLLTEAEAALSCGQLDRSERAAKEVMRLSDHVDEPRHQRAAEIVVLARCERGDTRGAAEAAREALARAVAFGDLTAVVTAQAALGAALLHAGRAEEARAHYEAARAGAVELGDVVRTIHVVSDLAGCCFETADYSQCVQLLGEARELADRIGYRRHLAFNLGNEAQLRAALADPYAGACAAAAAECSLEMGDLTATANAVHSWITADVDLVGDERLWRRLRRVDDRLGRRRAAAADAAEMAVAASRAGRLDAVAKLAGRALEAAREADAPDAVRRAQLALSLARTRAGADVAAGGESATTGLDGDPAEHQLTAVERAELAVERWRVSLSPADREAARALLEGAFRDEPSTLVRSWFSVLGEPVPVEPMPLPPPAGIGRALASRAELNKTLAVLERAVTGRSSVVSDSK